MVHADASTFSDNVTKREAYAQVLEQAAALFQGQRNWVLETLCQMTHLVKKRADVYPSSNLANAASLLWHAFHSLPYPSNRVNWAGFYTIHPLRPNTLILGPFQGKVACQTIDFGRGVCGASAATARAQLVDDVEKFPGHISCDSESQSEIVIPVVVRGKVFAIIDIDCSVKKGFDKEDQIQLETLARLIGESCDW